MLQTADIFIDDSQNDIASGTFEANERTSIELESKTFCQGLGFGLLSVANLASTLRVSRFVVRPTRSWQSYRPLHVFSAERRPFCSYVRTLQLVSFLSRTRIVPNIHSPTIYLTNLCHSFDQSETTFSRKLDHVHSLVHSISHWFCFLHRNNNPVCDDVYFIKQTSSSDTNFQRIHSQFLCLFHSTHENSRQTNVFRGWSCHFER